MRVHYGHTRVVPLLVVVLLLLLAVVATGGVGGPGLGRARRAKGRPVPELRDDVHLAVDAGLLGLGIRRLDDLVKGGEGAEPSQPHEESLPGVDVLAVKVERELRGDPVVPHGVDVLHELRS